MVNRGGLPRNLAVQLCQLAVHLMNHRRHNLRPRQSFRVAFGQSRDLSVKTFSLLAERIGIGRICDRLKKNAVGLGYFD